MRTRADAGYFTADLAKAAVAEGCDFAIAAKRNSAMWRAYASIEAGVWADAIDMPGAQGAAVDYAPAGWPTDTYTIVRRVRIDADTISLDPRSRRRRTIEAGQLALAYKVFRCWVSEFQALPDLDANANAVAIQHIKLENEGWERDYEVPEPTEPTFTEPA